MKTKKDKINVKISEDTLFRAIDLLGDSLKDKNGEIIEPTTVGQRNKLNETIMVRKALRVAIAIANSPSSRQ